MGCLPFQLPAGYASGKKFSFNIINIKTYFGQFFLTSVYEYDYMKPVHWSLVRKAVFANCICSLYTGQKAEKTQEQYKWI